MNILKHSPLLLSLMFSSSAIAMGNTLTDAENNNINCQLLEEKIIVNKF
jgi:hypothetical protein